MWPFLYDAVENLPGTLRGAQLTMPIEAIVRNEFVETHTLLDK